jgi:YD repeat-containing protein
LGRVKATALNTTTPIWTYYTFHGFSENNTSYTSSLIRTEQNKDFGFKYNYDANGNMTKLFVGTNTGGTDYTYSATETERYYYDALGQLTQVNYNDRNRKVSLASQPLSGLDYEDDETPFMSNRLLVSL